MPKEGPRATERLDARLSVEPSRQKARQDGVPGPSLEVISDKDVNFSGISTSPSTRLGPEDVRSEASSDTWDPHEWASCVVTQSPEIANALIPPYWVAQPDPAPPSPTRPEIAIRDLQQKNTGPAKSQSAPPDDDVLGNLKDEQKHALAKFVYDFMIAKDMTSQDGYLIKDILSEVQQKVLEGTGESNSELSQVNSEFN